MKRSIAVALSLLVLPAWGASQVKAYTPVATVSATTVTTDTPLIAKWRMAQTLLDVAASNFNLLGPSGVQTHVSAIEDVLAQADTSNDATSRNGDIFILADGAAESALAQGIGEGARSRYSHGYGRVVVVDNPYPTLALMLGAYYAQTGRDADALRAFDRGLGLSAFPQVRLGVHEPGLIAAKSVALTKLNRLPEALAICDDALTSMVLGTADKARLYRDRGFALLQMGRLDDADAAYRQALKLEPDSAVAKQQLDAIAKRKAAGSNAPGATPQQKAN